MRHAWLGLWLAACAASQARAPAPVVSAPRTASSGSPSPETPSREQAATTGGRPPTALERGVVDRLARDAERIRGLSFREPVMVEIQDPSTIAAHLDAELDDADLRRAQRVYETLGLLPDGLDLRALLSEVLGEQVLGFYDTRRRLLVLRDEVAATLLRAPSSDRAAESRVVILHELVHALQDQCLGFGRLLETERDSDTDNALKALAEGDATLAMIFYAAEQRDQSPEALLESGMLERMLEDLSAPASSDALSRAPAILRVTLVVPYIAGVAFARRIYEGGGWSEVNHAFTTPPTSTEQVMHPRTYLRRENPDPIAIGPLQALETAGWTVVEEDTLGELELGVFLGRAVGDTAGRAAAAGWAGDRLRIYERTGQGAAVWFTTWDDEAEAQQAAAAAAADRDQRVERRGRAVLVLRGLPTSLQAPVVVAFERFAAELATHPPRAPSTLAP